MKLSFLFVFLFNLTVCFVLSSAYFLFEKVAVAFAGPPNKSTANLYDQPLRYVNWIVPILTPILMCHIRSLRLNLHQSLIFSLVSIGFLAALFYAIEWFHLVIGSIDLPAILTKLRLLQIAYSFVLSTAYWVNFVSLVSYFKGGEILIIESCYVLITLLGNLSLNYEFATRSYFSIYALAFLLLLVVYFVFQILTVEMKDDFKALPVLKYRIHVLKRPIVLSSLIESFCIGGLLFLHFSACFGLFLLTFVPTLNPELAKSFHQKLNAIAYFPFLVGTCFGLFFVSTFSLAGVKKTVWSMAIKNLLFVYVWSLLLGWKVPFGIFDGLFYFCIAVNLLVQNNVIIEQLRSKTEEESETVTLLAPGIQSLGILLSWIILSTVLSVHIYFYGIDFIGHHQMYMYSGLLVVLFLCVFNHILCDKYDHAYDKCPAPASPDNPVIRISREMFV